MIAVMCNLIKIVECVQESTSIDMATNQVLPKIPFEDQKILYDQFVKQIENESIKDQMDNFVDSRIDTNLLHNFSGKLEENSILAIDLGGSSLKISMVDIKYGSGRVPIFNTRHSVVYSYENCGNLKDIKWNDWAALKIKEYAIEMNLPDLLSQSIKSGVNLGSLTFSFKLRQESISYATVAACSKNYKFSKEGLYDRNVVDEFNKSLKEAGVNLKITCVINDVIATYAAAIALGYKNPIGVILGTGTNAGFIIKRFGKQVLINSEWAFTNPPSNSVDRVSREIFESMGSNSLLFEILVAGFKFLEIIKGTAEMYFPNSPMVEMIDLKFINAIYYDQYENENKKIFYLNFISENKEFVDMISEIIYSFKMRAFQIIAPMIIAAAGNEDFSLFMNGSFIAEEKDKKMLKSEILKFLELAGIGAKLTDFVFEANSTLHGAAFVSLVSKST